MTVVKEGKGMTLHCPHCGKPFDLNIGRLLAGRSLAEKGENLTRKSGKKWWLPWGR